GRGGGGDGGGDGEGGGAGGGRGVGGGGGGARARPLRRGRGGAAPDGAPPAPAAGCENGRPAGERARAATGVRARQAAGAMAVAGPDRMSAGVRLAIAVASLALLAVFVAPLWRIDLEAPQYPEGLG